MTQATLPQPRDFKKEFEDKVRELRSTPELFEGTTFITSLKKLAELAYKRLPNMNVSQFRLPLFVEILAILNGSVTEIDLVNFVIFVNFSTDMTAKEMELSVEEFVNAQVDLKIITDNYNKVVAFIKDPLEKEAKEFNERMQKLQAARNNPPGKRK